MPVMARFVGGSLDGTERELPLGRRLIEYNWHARTLETYERRKRTDRIAPTKDGLSPEEFMVGLFEYVLIKTESPG